MLKKLTFQISALTFVLVLLLLAIQTWGRVFPEPRLEGVTVDTPKPAFSLTSWFNGTFQSAFEQWVNEHTGFRSFWVRTYNQVNFNLFRQISSTKGTNIVLGKNNWLYGKGYLHAYAYPPPVQEENIERISKKLRRLQDELEKRQIAFLLIISPSKVAVYPEYLPKRYQQPSEEITYLKTLPFLEKYGIRYIDAYKILAEAKPHTPYLLFPQGGIHWNSYGVLLVFREIVKRLNPFLKDILPLPEYESVELAPPRGVDNDFAKLTNIWTTNVLEGLCPYPALITTPLSPEKQPEILIVGDSFAWQIIELFLKQRMSSHIEVLYYYKRHVVYPQLHQQQFDEDKADWAQLLLKKDIVLIEINQAFLHDKIGFGFVEDALEVLEKNPL